LLKRWYAASVPSREPANKKNFKKTTNPRVPLAAWVSTKKRALGEIMNQQLRIHIDRMDGPDKEAKRLREKYLVPPPMVKTVVVNYKGQYWHALNGISKRSFVKRNQLKAAASAKGQTKVNQTAFLSLLKLLTRSIKPNSWLGTRSQQPCWRSCLRHCSTPA